MVSRLSKYQKTFFQIIVPLLFVELAFLNKSIFLKNEIFRIFFIFLFLFLTILYFIFSRILKIKSEWLFYLLLYFTVYNSSIIFFSPESELYKYSYTVLLIPLLIMAPILIVLSFSENSKLSIAEKNKYVLDCIVSLGMIGALLYLYWFISDNPRVNVKNISLEVKCFYFYKVLYFFLLSLLAFSLKYKIKKRKNNTLVEAIICVFLFTLYIVASFYLFYNQNYLNGDISSFLQEITRYLGMTTCIIYSIILISAPSESRRKLNNRRFYLFFIFFIFLMFFPIIIKVTEILSPDLLLLIKNPSGFISTVAISILSSIVSAFLLNFILKKRRQE